MQIGASAARIGLIAVFSGVAGAYINERVLTARPSATPVTVAGAPTPLPAKVAAPSPSAAVAGAAFLASVPYLEVPAVVEAPNARFVKPYLAQRKGVKVRYAGNLFSKMQPDFVWVPEIEASGRVLLRWMTSENGKPGLLGIFPGNVLEITDDRLFDFGVGTLFVKVRHPSGIEGYTLLETIIGDTEPADDGLWVSRDIERVRKNTTVKLGDVTLYEKYISGGPPQVESEIKRLSATAEYATSLSGGQKGGVHPLLGASAVYGLLMAALRPDIDKALRGRAIEAAETFFRVYAIPSKVELAPGAISWPFHFEWNLNWGIKLSDPWYSAYCNSQMIAAAALLYRMTEKPVYREIARQAARYLELSIEKGGSEYSIGGFRLPAEYVYPTPPLPNIRVIDGELGTAIAVYNAARLLGDSGMLRLATRHLASLATQLDLFTMQNGELMFAMYVEKMPEHYRWMIWSLLQVGANVMKDRNFITAANRMRPSVPQQWCTNNGC